MDRFTVPRAVGFLSFLVVSPVNAAWVINSPTGDLSGPSGTWSALPVEANYDPGNTVDMRGFDINPVVFDFTWTTGNSEPISFALVPPTGQTGASIEVNIDPDGDGLYPTSIGFTVDFNQALQTRGAFGGGLAAAVNASLGLSMDIDTQWTDGTGSLLDVSTLSFDGYDTPAAGATVVSVNNHDAFANLTNSGRTTTALPFGSSDPTQYILSQTTTLDNFDTDSGNSILFRLTFDGGVSQIPEPSSSLLVLLGVFGLTARRPQRG